MLIGHAIITQWQRCALTLHSHHWKDVNDIDRKVLEGKKVHTHNKVFWENGPRNSSRRGENANRCMHVKTRMVNK